MELAKGRFRSLIERRGKYLRHVLGHFRRAVEPRDPLVAIIRREGVIAQGRYIMYFEVTLFGNNPVVLEEFGHVVNRAHEPPPPMRKELAEIVEGYRYFIEIRQRFKSIEEAREFWVARGATALWHE